MTDMFLRENGLEHLRYAVEVVVRQVAPVMYYEEVHRLGLENELSTALLSVLGTDSYI
jgi:hypothetical protein